MGHELGTESVYKQYTYARNVIQWNLDIFNDFNKTVKTSNVRLRDENTEGYEIIPNFFISAKMDEGFNYTKDGIEKTDRQNNKYKQLQFKNRLFDRDTLLLFHYDVNFLFVLSLYARDNAVQKADWKEKVRNKFRKEIQDWLQVDYNFYAIKAHPDVNGEEYIKDHLKNCLAKYIRHLQTKMCIHWLWIRHLKIVIRTDSFLIIWQNRFILQNVIWENSRRLP